MTLFPAGQDLLGKKASDLVGEDLCVYEDGTVEGTLKAVTGYTGFSSEEEEQSGHYFPFKLTKTGKKMSLKKNGVAAEGKVNMTFDPEIRTESNPCYQYIWHIFFHIFPPHCHISF